MRRPIFCAGLLLACVLSAGCLDDSITGTRPISIMITVRPEATTVGELVTVSYVATGTGLSGVVVDWGDGEVDTIFLGGQLVEADGSAQHTYSAAGSYTVTGTANAQNGTASSEATVEIS